MRSTSALYRYACEEEGCVSNTELVRFFHGVDVALQPPTNRPGNLAETTNSQDAHDTEDAGFLQPLPPILASSPLIAFQPSLRYPTCITLRNTYLGDDGLAAFFRVLPMLRWLRSIDARQTGAGPNAIRALCGGLNFFLVEGCEEAPSRSLAHDDDTNGGGDSAAASWREKDGADDAEAANDDFGPLTHPLAGRVPALQSVDLRENDGIFSQSVEKLLAVLRRRRATLLQWCEQHGEKDADAVVLPALTVEVDAGNLLATTAHALQTWNAAAMDIQKRRQMIVRDRLWREQVRYFTVPKSAAVKLSLASLTEQQPVGENVIFRLPRSVPHQGDSGTEAEEATANAIREAINAHVGDFTRASCLLAPLGQISTPAVIAAAAQGSLAALQACADFGADALAILPYSDAAVWCAVRTSLQQELQQQEHSNGRDAPREGEARQQQQQQQQQQLRLREGRHRIGGLLRVLDGCPVLERELVASPLAGGVVVERHLHRLRVLYSIVCHAPTSASPSENDYAEMVSLYHRVVAALVTPHFSDEHLPSMIVVERQLCEIVENVLDCLVTGPDDAERLKAVVRRLREYGLTDLPWPAGAASAVSDDFCEKQKEERRISSEDHRLLPPIMAACYYHIQDHADVEKSWRGVYAAASSAVSVAARLSWPTVSAGLEGREAFQWCRCSAAEAVGVSDAATTTAKPAHGTSDACFVPCDACTFRALGAAQSALNDPKGIEGGASPTAAAAVAFHDEVLLRWKTLCRARLVLPRELRMFFLDMMVRQRSRSQGGCAFVPPTGDLDGVSPLAVRERWSMSAWLACTRDQENYWVQLLRVFAQWYRLQALELYGQPAGMALLRMPELVVMKSTEA